MCAALSATEMLNGARLTKIVLVGVDVCDSFATISISFLLFRFDYDDDIKNSVDDGNQTKTISIDTSRRMHMKRARVCVCVSRMNGPKNLNDSFMRQLLFRRDLALTTAKC